MAGSENKSGYGKLLDAWVKPDHVGDPVGCLATTFTFSPAFFEEECLGRFLRIDTDPSRDGPLYLIEREEKLSQIECAAVLVDQHHCKGSRSLRWDMMPARAKSGLLHAKVSLLVWTNMIRLIVASANITESGYRLNKEVFGVLDYEPSGKAQHECLNGTIRFLKDLIDQTVVTKNSYSPAGERWLALLNKAESMSSEWFGSEPGSRKRHGMIYPVFTGGNYPDAYDSLRSFWPSTSPASEAKVFSPFFNPPEAENKPAIDLWKFLRQRGSARCSFHVVAENVEDEQKTVVQAPESLLKVRPDGRKDVDSRIVGLDGDRPFHAKGMWLENTRWIVYMIGSSNFTSAGLGLGRVGNLEANLAYIVDKKKHRAEFNRLRETFPEGFAISEANEIVWLAESPAGEDDAGEGAVLPGAFDTAIYEMTDEDMGKITLTFNDDPPAEWEVLNEYGQEVFYSQRQWIKAGRLEKIELPWSEDRPPSGFWVKWKESAGKAWWPVNVLSQASLPVPEELKNIPLEILIEILTSSRPVHQILRKYLRQKFADGPPIIKYPELDPHKRVDTSNFLIQRTRKLSWALTMMRYRLERPVSNEKSLWWRLHGPIGVKALACALMADADRTKRADSYIGKDEVKAFLLSEIVLELYRAEPVSIDGYLPPHEVRKELLMVAGDLKEMIDDLSIDKKSQMGEYIHSVFEVANSEF